VLTLRGPGLLALCRQAWAYRDAASFAGFGTEDSGTGEGWLARVGALGNHALTRAVSLPRCAVYPVPAAASAPLPVGTAADGRPLVRLPGVWVRFAVADSQPGTRADDPLEEVMDPVTGEVTTIDIRGKVLWAPAFLPPDFRPDVHHDVPGGVNDVPTLRLDDCRVVHGAAARSGGDVDCLCVVAPAVPKPCVVAVEVIAFPPRAYASVVDSTGAAASLHLPVGHGLRPAPAIPDPFAAQWAPGARGASLPTVQPTLGLRGQVLPGRLTLAFTALPLVKASHPSVVKMESGGESAGGGRAADTLITLQGDALFGCALLDASARGDAEALIDTVKAAVRLRETEEAGLVAVARSGNGSASRSGHGGGDSTALTSPGTSLAVGLSPIASERGFSAGSMDAGFRGGADQRSTPFGLAPGTTPLPGARQGGASLAVAGLALPSRTAASAAVSAAVQGGPESGDGPEGEMDLTMPTLHLSRGSGTRDMPDEVLVRFAVLHAHPAGAGGPPATPASAELAAAHSSFQAGRRGGAGERQGSEAAISSSTLAAARLLGYSDAVRGWYTVRYDEEMVNVGSAINVMTGTTAAAANAKSVLSSSVVSGGGRGLSSSNAGLGSGLGGGSSAMHGAGTGIGGGGGGDDEDEEGAEDGDDEGVIGRYTATIACPLPSFPPALANLAGGGIDGGVADGGPVHIPDAVHAAWRALVEGTTTVASWAKRGDDAARGASAGGAAPPEDAAALFNFNHAFDEWCVSQSSGSDAGGRILLRPEISINGGVDFIPSLAAAVITAFAPSFSHVSPPAGPASGGYTMWIRGSGFIDTPSLAVRFSHPVTGTMTVVPATWVDGNTLQCTAPPLPLSDGGGGGAMVTSGHTSYSIAVTADGSSFATHPRLQVVVYAGGVDRVAPSLVPLGAGAALQLTLSGTAAGYRNTDGYVGDLPPPPAPVGQLSPLAPVASATVPAPAPSSGSATPATGGAGGRRSSLDKGKDKDKDKDKADVAEPPASPRSAAGAGGAKPHGASGRRASNSQEGTRHAAAAATAAAAAVSTPAPEPAPTAAPLPADHWLPLVARIGHPRVGVGSQVALRLVNPALRVEVGSLPVVAEARGGALTATIPPLRHLLEAAVPVGDEEVEDGALASGRSGTGGDVAILGAGTAKETFTPAARSWQAQLVVAGVPHSHVFPLRFYGQCPGALCGGPALCQPA